MAEYSESSEESKKQNEELEKQREYRMRSLHIVTFAVFILMIVGAIGVYTVSGRGGDSIYYYYEADTQSDSFSDTSAYEVADVSAEEPAAARNADTVISSKAADSLSSVSSKSIESAAPLTETTAAADNVSEVAFPIEINSVTLEELILINGIGEATAQKIIDFRSSRGLITSMESLVEIDGIGEKTISLLKQYLYVDDAYYQPYIVEQTQTDTVTQTEASPDTQTVQTEQTEQTTTQLPETEPVTTTTVQHERYPVNINHATAEELMDALLITEEQAQEIIELRSRILYFSNIQEMLFLKTMTQEEIVELKDYIIIDGVESNK